MADLTPLQAAFVEAFIESGDATFAAERAGYSARSRHYLSSRGHKLLGLPKIRAALEARGWSADAAEPSETRDTYDPLPEDPDEAIAELARRGAVHSTARLDALKFLSRQKRERERERAGGEPIEQLRGLVNAALRAKRARELAAEACPTCHRPYDDEETDR